jgi:hypothetical protein
MVLNLCEKFYLNAKILTTIISNIKNFGITLMAEPCLLFSYIFLDRILNTQKQGKVTL